MRIVYAKVLGTKVWGAAVEGKTLVPRDPISENFIIGAGREASQPSPRFDSSDSEAGEEEEYPEFWHA